MKFEEWIAGQKPYFDGMLERLKTSEDLLTILKYTYESGRSEGYVRGYALLRKGIDQLSGNILKDSIKCRLN